MVHLECEVDDWVQVAVSDPDTCHCPAVYCVDVRSRGPIVLKRKLSSLS